MSAANTVSVSERLALTHDQVLDLVNDMQMRLSEQAGLAAMIETLALMATNGDAAGNAEDAWPGIRTLAARWHQESAELSDRVGDLWDYCRSVREPR